MRKIVIVASLAMLGGCKLFQAFEPTIHDTTQKCEEYAIRCGDAKMLAACASVDLLLDLIAERQSNGSFLSTADLCPVEAKGKE